VGSTRSQGEHDLPDTHELARDAARRLVGRLAAAAASGAATATARQGGDAMLRNVTSAGSSGNRSGGNGIALDGGAAPAAGRGPVDLASFPGMPELKMRLHERLPEKLDLAALDEVPQADLRREVAALVCEALNSESTALNARVFSQLVDNLLDEVRGGEARDMLPAMNSGHDGSMTTIHAHTPRDAPGRRSSGSRPSIASVSPHAVGAIFALCPVGIALNDLATGRFIDVNAALLAATGYTREEMLALTLWDVTPAEDHAEVNLHLERMAETGRCGPCEMENIRKDGSRFPTMLSGMLVTDLAGRSLLWSIVEDISERKQAEAQIMHQAHHDDLTGLPNRRLFQERLKNALERARRGRHIGAVAMIDLDDFKTVNDGLGHQAGDAILVEAAARLTGCTRATDTVARFGGDEFLVLLDGLASIEVVDTVAGKMRRALARPYTVEGRQVEIGVSIGVALFSEDSEDPDELLRLADIAMYKAKRSGRDQIRFHGTVHDIGR
jgi:diguanylate cyclase (GGDEF)-like protein/PAS domain S-box-containing protein